MVNKTSKIKTIIILILGLGILGFMFFSPKKITPTNNTIAPVVTGNALDLVSLSFNPGDTLTGASVISGSVKNAYFFEANIIVKVTDISNNVLLTTHGSATTEWMTTAPVSFTANVNFTGLPVGPAYLVLENDNPSGDPALIKQIIIPIVIN